MRWLFFALMAVAGVVASADVNLLWPKEILVDCGNLQVRFESRSFWTLYRIDWKGARLGIDDFGSHYGSVARFPGVGFIGSGHTENEKEKIEKLELWIDGKPVTGIPSGEYRCREVRLIKSSALRDLRLHTVVSVHDDRIDESVIMSAVKDARLDLIYHFMHPWSLEVKEYLARKVGGEMLAGQFPGDNRFYVNAPLAWSAVYAPRLNAGAVMLILEVPGGVKTFSKFWDVPTRYRKHYLQSFERDTVKTGTSYRFVATVIPFSAEPGAWKATAEKLAGPR